MSGKYVMIKVEDDELSDSFHIDLSGFQEIHIYIKNKKFKKENILQLINADKQRVFMYCTNLSEYNFSIENNILPHICFIGDNIYNSELLGLTEKHEVFWAPTISCIDDSKVKKYAKQLSRLKSPVCVSIGEPFDLDLNHEEARLFIEKLHYFFDNPIVDIDKSNKVPMYLDGNQILVIKGGCVDLNPLVLGYFGDCIVKGSEFDRVNMKELLVKPSCSRCENQKTCMDMGLGYIMHKQRLKGCIHTKLIASTN